MRLEAVWNQSVKGLESQAIADATQITLTHTVPIQINGFIL